MSSRGQPNVIAPPTWVLGEVLTTTQPKCLSFYDIILYDICVNCNCVDTRFQLYGTIHIYTQTVHRITQNNVGTVRTVTCLCELYPGICIETEEKYGKPQSW